MIFNTYKKIIIIVMISIGLFALFADEPVELDIEKAVFLSLANSKDIKISKATLVIQNKAFWYELRKFLPTLSMGYSNSNSVAFDAPDTRNTKLNMDMNVLVFDGGKLIFDYITKKTEMEFAKKELLIQMNKLMAEVRGQYYSLILLERKERAQDELLKIGLIQEEHADLELSMGMISELDYYDIKLRVKQIQIDVQKIKKDKKNALKDFKYGLGIEKFDVRLVEDTDYDFLDLTDDDIMPLQSLALANRIDLSQSIHSVYKNKVQYWYTILSFLPEVSTGFNFTLTDTEFPPRNQSWAINFNITIPLAYVPMKVTPGIGGQGQNVTRSSSSTTSADIAQNLTYENDIANARINLATSGIKHKELIREISNQVQKGVEDYIEMRKIYRLKLAQNDFAKKKLEIMRLKLELGEVSRVDLLEEEMKYNESLINEQKLLFEIITGETALQEAIGNYDMSLKTLIQTYKKRSELINYDED